MEIIGDRNLVHFWLVSLHYPALMSIITSNTSRKGRVVGRSGGGGHRGQGSLPCAAAPVAPGRRAGSAGSAEGTRSTRWCAGADGDTDEGAMRKVGQDH